MEEETFIRRLAALEAELSVLRAERDHLARALENVQQPAPRDVTESDRMARLMERTEQAARISRRSATRSLSSARC